MSRKIIAFSLALACLLAAALPARAETPRTGAAHHALDYIRTLQNDDGGFPFFGSDSDAGSTIDAILAFVDDDLDIDDVQNAGNSPIDYLEDQAAAYTVTPDHAAKLVIGLVAAGEDPRDFAGANYVAKMQSYYDAATHRYGQQAVDQALYLLARASLDVSMPSGATAVLQSKQLPDGCWEYGGFGCDTNSTAMAIQALIAAGVDESDASIQDALAYLKTAQTSDGGFPYVAPGDSDANSTAFVLQALLAADEDVDAGGPWEKPGGRTPMQALLAYQDAATGAFTYAGEDNYYATYQAVPALLLQPLLLPPHVEPTKTPRPTHTPVATATAAIVAPTATPPAVDAQTTPLSQVLPVVAGATALPQRLAAAGQGAEGGTPAALPALLLVAGSCLAGGLLVRSVRGR